MSGRVPRGQVLVLAAVLALLLVGAVLATLAIGQTVHERVRLQHTADATAYSLSVAEARAFNLYAHVNRAHASHYVSAMAWQSLLSFLFFSEAFVTDLTGLAYSFPCLAPSGAWVSLCAAAERLPEVGGPLAFLQNVTGLLTQVTRGYQHALNGGDPGLGLASDAIDVAVGQELIPSFLVMNGALSAVARSVMEGTYAELRDVGAGIASENDPDLPPDAAELDTGAFGACLFARAHQAPALGRPSEARVDPFAPLSPRARRDADPVARAKRTMAAVANATRAGCAPGASRECPDTFVTARPLGMGWALPPGLEGIRDFLARAPKWGQTRLLSFGMGGADGQNFIREPEGAPDVPTGMLAQGDNLGADDVYTFPLGPFACTTREPADRCWGDPRHGARLPGQRADAQRPFRTMTKTSIWALNADERLARRSGVHWRVAYPRYPQGPGHRAPEDLGNDHPERRLLGLHEARRRLLGRVPVSVYVANVRAIQDGHHPWAGIVPFPSFEPGQFEAACTGDDPGTPADLPARREDDFNQPSVWVSLRKSPPALRRASEPSGSAAPEALRLETGTAHLETGFGRAGSTHAEGLHALARGQTYYHRPGDWAEHPNFFNPFWRARLAATLQGNGLAPPLARWLNTLPAPLRSAPERVLTH